MSAYYLKLRSNLPKICEKLSSKENHELSKIEIQLLIWDPIRLKAIDYVMKNIKHCEDN